MRTIRRLVSIVLIAGLIFSFTGFCTSALAAEDKVTDSDFVWVELSDGTVAIMAYNGTAADVTIPSTLGGKTVTMIEDWSFNGKGINSVTIPSSVTNIGYASFANNHLTKLIIPDGVTTIEDGAFYNNRITSITIPSSVTTIMQDAFQINCISKISIESDTTNVGVNVFGDQTVDLQIVTEWWDNTGTSVDIYGTRSGAVTYYAKFTANVEFQENGGSAVTDITGQNGFTLVSKPENPTKDGYRCDGWFLDNATFEDEWDFDTDVLEGDIVLYAKWVIPVTDITLSSASETLIHHDTLKLTATVLPDNAAYPEVTWTSSDESVATVDTEGNITAVGAGSAVITATADGVSATCDVKVNPISVTSITLSKNSADMKISNQTKLTATVLPENTTYPDVIWTSSNNNVATVDADGNVTAIGVGNTVITGTADGSSATCDVKVNPISITSITLSKNKDEMKIGNQTKLTTTVLPENATYPDVTYTSSNNNVATVDTEGTILAAGVGNATITATADGKSAVCEVSVTSDKPEPADAQKGNIRGTLVDSNGNPLAGYTVTLHSNPITTTTDSNGVFAFENVPLTNHTLLIESKDENEIGRYSLSFTQDDSTSFTSGEKEISIKNTPNTVAVDVLINVSEDGNSTQIDTVTFKENPQTGEDSSISSIECLAIIIGLVIIISMSAVYRVKFKKD